MLTHLLIDYPARRGLPYGGGHNKLMMHILLLRVRANNAKFNHASFREQQLTIRLRQSGTKIDSLGGTNPSPARFEQMNRMVRRSNRRLSPSDACPEMEVQAPVLSFLSFMAGIAILTSLLTNQQRESVDDRTRNAEGISSKHSMSHGFAPLEKSSMDVNSHRGEASTSHAEKLTYDALMHILDRLHDDYSSLY